MRSPRPALPHPKSLPEKKRHEPAAAAQADGNQGVEGVASPPKWMARRCNINTSIITIIIIIIITIIIGGSGMDSYGKKAFSFRWTDSTPWCRLHDGW